MLIFHKNSGFIFFMNVDECLQGDTGIYSLVKSSRIMTNFPSDLCKNEILQRAFEPELSVSMPRSIV